MAEPDDAALILICSVPLEADPLQGRMEQSRPLAVGRKRATAGRIAGVPVLLLQAGMGKANAAQGLTAALERYPAAKGVVGFGVGGAYPGSGLDVGSLALADAEVYGDEGVSTPTGWISTEGIGIPLLERDGRRAFNRFALDPGRVEAAERALAARGLAFGRGAFVTVSSCSGTLRRGEELAARFGAVCETMEGAACAHVAALYDVPFLEVRGISNRVEDRDLAGWRLRDAAEAGALAAEALVGGYAL